MAKAKVFKVTATNDSTGKTNDEIGTLSELVRAYSYTLECGRSWEHEKGNKKINTNPKTIKSFVTNLTNAVNNTAANGYAGKSFDWEEVV
jgi:hypothetical protein